MYALGKVPELLRDPTPERQEDGALLGLRQRIHLLLSAQRQRRQRWPVVPAWVEHPLPGLRWEAAFAEILNVSGERLRDDGQEVARIERLLAAADHPVERCRVERIQTELVVASGPERGVANVLMPTTKTRVRNRSPGLTEACRADTHGVEI